MNHLAYLVDIVPPKNKYRFYKMLIHPDMLGGYSLVREYGHIGRPGTVILNWHSSKEDAIKTMNRLIHQKLKRGYKTTTKNTEINA